MRRKNFSSIKIIFLAVFLLSPLFASADITSGLLGHWAFDNGAGAMASDSSTHGRSATLHNGPTWTDGQIGGGLLLDGNDDYVTLGAFRPGDEFTLSLWLQPRANVEGISVALFAKVFNGPTDLSPKAVDWYLSWQGSSGLQFTVSDGVTLSRGILGNTNTLPASEWTHITLTKKKDKITLYKNAALEGTATLGSAFTQYTSTFPFILGTFRDDKHKPFNGMVDDVRIYNRALSSFDITELHTYGARGDFTPPLLRNGLPQGELPTGITSTRISFDTNESATCRYDTTANTAYANMRELLSVTGGVSHNTTLEGLSDGNQYTLYIKCTDVNDNSNTVDYILDFTVGGTVDSMPPSLSPQPVLPPPSPVAGPPQPPPATGAGSCLFSRTLTLGSRGEDVRALQVFLNQQGFTIATTRGGSPGNETTYFGTKTKEALIRFQEAHRNEVLTPLGFSRGTGVFGPSTARFIDTLGVACDITVSPPLPRTTPPPPVAISPPPSTGRGSVAFSRTLTLGSRGEDVRALQVFLNQQGFTIATTRGGSPGNETTYFGTKTKEALIRFQEAHRNEVLTPLGFSRGTGVFGPSTIKYINKSISTTP